MFLMVYLAECLQSNVFLISLPGNNFIQEVTFVYCMNYYQCALVCISEFFFCVVISSDRRGLPASTMVLQHRGPRLAVGGLQCGSLSPRRITVPIQHPHNLPIKESFRALIALITPHPLWVIKHLWVIKMNSLFSE